MTEMAVLSTQLSAASLDEDVKTYRAELDACYKSYERSRRFNQHLSIWFTSLSIILTMLAAIFAVADDTSIMGINQKVLVAILGATSVAVQTAARQFPVDARSRKFLELRNSTRELILELSLVENVSDLKSIKAKYVELLKLENTLA